MRRQTLAGRSHGDVIRRFQGNFTSEDRAKFREVIERFLAPLAEAEKRILARIDARRRGGIVSSELDRHLSTRNSEEFWARGTGSRAQTGANAHAARFARGGIRS